MEWKDGRLQLPNVTLMAMTSVNVRQTIKAMQYSMRQIDFGDCVLITHRKPFFLPKGIRYAHTSKLTKEANLPFEPDHGSLNEDGFLCVKNHHLIEAAGMKIAPLEVAKYFAHETMIPEIEGITPFAFHKWAGTNAQYPKF